MLVRAGHRCPTCFCLTSLCRCRRERIIFCLCSGPSGHTARSHQEPAHASLCASQAADFSFHFRLAPLLISCVKKSVRNPDPNPHGWQHPHPCQWQVLYRSYSRRQRRLSRRARENRPLPSAVAQSVFHSVCNWLHTLSPLATMNPHRPGGGPRQHYRPDGSRRRTAGELAKRAAKAAARAAAAAAGAAGAAGGGAAKSAGPAGSRCRHFCRRPSANPGSGLHGPHRGAVNLGLSFSLVFCCGPGLGNYIWTCTKRLPRSNAAPAPQHCCWP